MSISLRQIRRRIKSVEGTKQMTHAMELVAAAKLRRLQELLAESDAYLGELARILKTLLEEKSLRHPLLDPRPEAKNTLAFLIASDTGLCGSYNTNVLDQVNPFQMDAVRDRSVRFVALGHKGADYLKRNRLEILNELKSPRPQQTNETIHEVAKIATESFVHHEADQVVFIFTKAESLASLKPRIAQLFPIAPLGSRTEVKVPVDYLLEPTVDQLLEILLSEYVEAQVGQFVKHSLVAEQVSRMLAMRQATDNAEEMTDSLTLIRNKVRQATITKELIEVVAGSRAQKK